MAEETNILWADGTLSFWIGCTKVGPACDNCYAEVYGNRFGVKWGPGEERRMTMHWLKKAMVMERLALKWGRPYFCFSNSLSDIFDNEVPIEALKAAFDVMRQTPHVIYLLLTKRAPNILKRCEEAGGLPPNAALGVTVVTQAEANRDVVTLLLAKQALNPVFVFVSMEPLIEMVDLTRITTLRFPGAEVLNALTGVLSGLFGDYCPTRLPKLDWVITGFESGPHARVPVPGAAEALRDQCARHSTAFLFKQWGEWAPRLTTNAKPNMPTEETKRLRVVDGFWFERVGTEAAGNLLDGEVHDARPEVRMAA